MNQTYPNFLHKQIGIIKDFFTFSCFRFVSTLIKDVDEEETVAEPPPLVYHGFIDVQIGPNHQLHQISD